MSGPDNWARLQVVQLDEPDQDGNLLRVVLAFDTRAAAPGQETLAPGESDLGTGLNFALAHRNHELGEFLDLTRVDGWLREAFSQRAAEREQRAEVEINAGLKTFEYQAHYLNLLHMLGHQLAVPQIKWWRRRCSNRRSTSIWCWMSATRTPAACWSKTTRKRATA